MNKDLFGEYYTDKIKNVLSDRFIESPFSILNSQKGNWLKRKRQWIKLGIKSEVSREGVNMHSSFKPLNYNNLKNKSGVNNGGFFDNAESKGGASIFNPALAELMYEWFLEKGDHILDPFAGGSVRGIVANYLGYKYTGVDIREEQVEANRNQALDILPVNNQPQWYVGDSLVVIDELNLIYDCIFTCPPYFDLEVYSDIDGDLSIMSYDNFIKTYKSILLKCINKLKINGFFIIVVGDVRDKNGFYYNLTGETKNIIINGGCKLYNELVYQTPIGLKCLAANNLMKTKKIGKNHEYVFIFKKINLQK